MSPLGKDFATTAQSSRTKNFENINTGNEQLHWDPCWDVGANTNNLNGVGMWYNANIGEGELYLCAQNMENDVFLCTVNILQWHSSASGIVYEL